MENMVRAAEVSGTAPFARIGLGVHQNILRFLDAGVIGAQIPLVNTGEQARAVVEAVKYPPIGKRGLAGVRAGSFGILESMGDYVASANRETLVTVQVETTEALDNLDDILAVDGVDVVFLGPSDLSSSMGYTGQPTHPDVITAIAGAGKRIAAAGKYAGTIAPRPGCLRSMAGGRLPVPLHRRERPVDPVSEGLPRGVPQDRLLADQH